MNERREYELSDEQYRRLWQAAQPVPLMIPGGDFDLSLTDPRERLIRAWKQLGEEMGFDPRTSDHPGGEARRFTAVPSTPPSTEAK